LRLLKIGALAVSWLLGPVFRLARKPLAALSDHLYSPRVRAFLELNFLRLSILAFLAHLALIAVVRTMAAPPAAIVDIGKNYFSAIYTPFTIILFYEVLLLIGSIPESTTQSIARQFEIVSLIFIRGFFKDIAAIDVESLHIQQMRVPLTDAVAGLLMFLLVTIFRRIAQHRPVRQAPNQAELAKFIERKKAIALILTLVLVALEVYAGVDFFHDEIIHAGPLPNHHPAFYTDMFTVMIFTDVLILIFSLVVSDQYEMVFRNAGFVVATILTRLSLTAEQPYGPVIGIGAMIFAIITLAIYNFNNFRSSH